MEFAFRCIQDLKGQIDGTGEFFRQMMEGLAGTEFQYNTKEGLGDVKDRLPTMHALGECGRDATKNCWRLPCIGLLINAVLCTNLRIVSN